MEGEILLDRDLAPAEGALRKWVVVPLTQNQFDALVCFIYNVGVGAFRESTLLHQLNSGKYDEVPAQLRRWNKEWDTKKRQFVVNKGLAIRREQEVVRWLER
jgi:lysozyme